MSNCSTEGRVKDMDFKAPPPSPIESAKAWFDEAEKVVMTENPLAMTLSTCLPEGNIASRIVLMKSFSEDGVLFFTNYNSDKAMEIECNNNVALLFHWDTLARQIRIRGRATKVAGEVSDEYFATRQRLSQLGAWASDQSKTIECRDELMARVSELEAKWDGEPITRPPFWGGFCVSLDSIEFWQGGDGRLHDRLFYSFDKEWSFTRLQP
ncbi:MAG: pyridoxamine 5'-phosphate oxidase [Planctomycetota bacterium]|nr:pyridoxamine 5'-phosphate oxidase [Planctomycetota bacterium]